MPAPAAAKTDKDRRAPPWCLAASNSFLACFRYKSATSRCRRRQHGKRIKGDTSPRKERAQERQHPNGMESLDVLALRSCELATLSSESSSSSLYVLTKVISETCSKTDRLRGGGGGGGGSQNVCVAASDMLGL